MTAGIMTQPRWGEGWGEGCLEHLKLNFVWNLGFVFCDLSLWENAMKKIEVDAKGLACPQPVVLTKNALGDR